MVTAETPARWSRAASARSNTRVRQARRRPKGLRRRADRPYDDRSKPERLNLEGFLPRFAPAPPELGPVGNHEGAARGRGGDEHGNGSGQIGNGSAEVGSFREEGLTGRRRPTSAPWPADSGSRGSRPGRAPEAGDNPTGANDPVAATAVRPWPRRHRRARAHGVRVPPPCRRAVGSTRHQNRATPATGGWSRSAPIHASPKGHSGPASVNATDRMKSGLLRQLFDGRDRQHRGISNHHWWSPTSGDSGSNSGKIHLSAITGQVWASRSA